MPIRFLALLAILLIPLTAGAQTQSPVLGKCETIWPGIDYQINFIKRIPPGRLLVGVWIVATDRAPAGGTTIGTSVPIPPNATREQIMSGIYREHPIALNASVMTEDLTGTTYPALSPIAPPGRAYPPAVAMGQLKPNQGYLMTLQFAVPPPPPPPPPGQPPVKQTLSFNFPNAKGSITKIPIPPPVPPSVNP